MHIIYFDRHDKRHTINISRRLRYLFIIFFCGLSASFFYYGYYYGLTKNLDQNAQQKWVASWIDELGNQDQKILNAKNDIKLHLDAFSEQMAKQQAHIARLDALAMYLGKLANIDSDLFNFNEKLSEQDLYSNDGNDNNDSNESNDNKNNNHNEQAAEFMGVFDLLSNNISVLDNQLNLLQSVLKYQKLDRQTMVKGKPIKKGYISSYYGYRNHPIKKRQIFHRGIDFVNKEGTPILAVASGVVTWAGPKGGYGNLVEVNHGDGYSTRYAHNNKVLVNIGDLVNKGDDIAEMGSTGKSTGNHVHFEVWRDGRSENPITYLTKK